MVQLAVKNHPEIEANEDTLETQVYKEIKSAIQHKEIKPGTRVSYAEWAERLGISRTPVRDALRRLEYEGLVVRTSERVWYIYTLTLEEIEKIFDARETVDSSVAYYAAKNITEGEIAEMDQIIAEMEGSLQHNDYEEFHYINDRFHDLMNRASRNAYLVRYSTNLNERLSRVYPKGINIEGRLARGVAENKRIAAAIRAHDAEGAQQRQLAHLRSYRKHLRKVIQEMVIPYSGPEF
ncbi:MAG: GntR family transcriptional regulator [Anaerolineales bacterium]|nr:GntR family transcriptional regulator [Anaerolineales bacterium]